MTATTKPVFQAKYIYRSPAAVTWAVWKGLFLRETLTRLMTSRSAPLWLVFEPVFHFSYMLFVLTVVRARVATGMDTIIWLLAGILPFFVFRRIAVQASKAIGANQALFTYRQVKPIDTILVRSFLETFIMVIVSLIVFAGVHLLGYDVFPADPAIALLWLFGLIILGLGWALIASVARELIVEAGEIIDMLQAPLYIISGVIFPIAHIPHVYREWLMLNPIAHGIDGIRQAYSPYYHGVPEASMSYLYLCGVSGLFIGLALQRHLATQLASK